MDDTRKPMPIKFFKQKNVLDFACGECHTLAITEKNEVYAWGSGEFGELGNGMTEN